MTTQDLTTIAHAAGTAGQSWEQFQGDDAVQTYVCANDDYENHVEAWRAAWQIGTIQHLTARGWVSRWTTAPTDYDCFGTLTAELCGDWYGKPLRRILCHPHHAGYQEGRNGSGMHPTWSVDPRIGEREAAERHDRLARLRAEDESRRAAGLVWLAGASEAEIEDAKERDEIAGPADRGPRTSRRQAGPVRGHRGVPDLPRQPPHPGWGDGGVATVPRLWWDRLGAMTVKGWCPNSGTYASFTERGLVGGGTIAAGHARCEHCGRLLKLRKNNVIPHHRVTPGSFPQPGSQGDKSR